MSSFILYLSEPSCFPADSFVLEFARIHELTDHSEFKNEYSIKMRLYYGANSMTYKFMDRYIRKQHRKNPSQRSNIRIRKTYASTWNHLAIHKISLWG